MQFLRRYCSLSLLTSFAFLIPSIEAATQNYVDKTFEMPHSTLSATIDGDLHDEIWQNAKTFPLNIVNYPWNNKKSPVKTTAKIIENGEFIYVSFIAEDPNPEKIQAFLGDRDTRWGDDIVGIKFDTFNNRRLNYEFFVNPFGVQHDSIKNEMTGSSNASWNGIWDSYGKITPNGYQVEMAIPYRILNFEDNQAIKTWAFELIRSYPRDTRLRISHIPLDRNNDCWLCQYPTLQGFQEAKTGNNLMITPAVVANKNETRDIYNAQSDWQAKKDVDAGVDLRWGINANTLLNVTLNPDFSTVEVDSGQLSINETFSLFYDEKRSFFLENADYFASDYDLVYTRNISDPDYGAKLTGTNKAHSYGVFITNDKQTNFFVPGNTESNIAILNTESHSAAFKYRYDFNDNLSVGAISTLRTADEYHNYVVGIDSKYRLDDSNTLSGQVLTSNTEYPTALFKSFCYGNTDDDCNNAQDIECVFGNCQFTEQVHRTKFEDKLSDQAFKATYEHNSEYWDVTVEHQNIGKEFRADLGYMPRADYQSDKVAVKRYFYGEEDTFWQEASLSGNWQINHSEKGELLNKILTSSFAIDGPMQSNFDLKYTYSHKVGLRHDESDIAIDNNTTLFNEKFVTLYSSIQPTAQLFLEAEFIVGDKIDYRNNRLGDYQEIYSKISYNFTRHLEAELYFTNKTLDTKEGNVYQADLTELRVSYQFDVHSYLKLNLVYSDIDRNPDNNPFIYVSKKNKNLSTQLIYAYKLNPQTVFYLGYSDNSLQDDDLPRMEQDNRTFFTKISYAWMP